MKNFAKLVYKDVIAVVVMLALTAALTYVFMDMDNFDIRYPMSYDGGDGMSYLVNAVSLKESNTTMESDRLGAPYGYYGYDFYASSLHGFDNLVLKIIVTFTDSPAVAVNILFLSVFPTIALLAYFALRQMHIKCPMSVAGALTFTFMPYLFMRGMNHFVLACYYFVPISVLFCVWVYEDDNFFRLNKGFWRNWRNYFAIILSACIANNGIAYYAFFTCFFLVVTGLVKAFKERKASYFGKAAALIVLISGFMVAALIPNVIYIYQNGSNEDGLVRTLDGVETYSLKIAQLFMPLDSHGSELLENIITEYNDAMPLVNENYMSYLGVMGCVGFLILIVVLFLKKMGDDKPYKVKLELLSLLNIAGILLATIGGFGSLFGLLVTDMIRCYNRISIFIAFMSIAAFCIVMDVLGEKIYARANSDDAEAAEKAAAAEGTDAVGATAGATAAEGIEAAGIAAAATATEGTEAAGIAAGAAAAEDVKTAKSGRNAASRALYGIYIAVCAAFTLWGIWFQYPGLRFDYVNFKEYYISDHEFVTRIEDSLPEGSMIYQLPYHEYPEGGAVNNMNDYDLWIGYIHSKTLKWSYGGVVGREADDWLKTIDNSDIPAMVSAIKEKGFAGIYIDRRAYEDEEIVELENALKAELGTQPIVSGNSALSFFYINY